MVGRLGTGCFVVALLLRLEDKVLIMRRQYYLVKQEVLLRKGGDNFHQDLLMMCCVTFTFLGFWSNWNLYFHSSGLTYADCQL